MLVLSRKSEEVIVFPTLGVSVKVLRIRGRSVSLGISAPKNVRVQREELADQIHREELRHGYPR
jgi:carbon storage regulator CsrA